MVWWSCVLWRTGLFLLPQASTSQPKTLAPEALALCILALALCFSAVDRTRLWLRFKLPALLWRAEVFFWFLYCCCKYVTSSAHQASTPWYATTPVRHLVGAVCFIFFTIRTKIVCQHFRYRHRHRLHRQFHHRCIVGIFDSRPMQLTKVKFFNIYRNLPVWKKKRKSRRGKQSNTESPNPRGSTDSIKEADSSFERRTRRHRWRWALLMSLDLV